MNFNQILKRAMDGKKHESLDYCHLDTIKIDARMQNLMENNIKLYAPMELLLKKMQILNHSMNIREVNNSWTF